MTEDLLQEVRPEMEEKEYLEFLEAVAVEYIWLRRYERPWHIAEFDWLNRSLDELTSIADLSRIVGERRENELLRRALGSELKRVGWDAVHRALDERGITEALDQHGEALLGGFRRSVVPEADLAILRRAGVEHPEAALRIAEERARIFARGAATRDFRASNVLQSAGRELKKAGAELESESEAPSKRSRKWFKGISRILAGGAGALGNVLLGVGTLPAAAPVGAAAVLASCTGGLVLIGDGIEALRGNE